MKEKFKSFNFWISLTSVLILFIRIIGDKFGVSIDENGFMDIMVLLCTVFVVLGIFDVPKTNIKTEDGENGITTISSSVAKMLAQAFEIKQETQNVATEIKQTIEGFVKENEKGLAGEVITKETECQSQVQQQSTTQNVVNEAIVERVDSTENVQEIGVCNDANNENINTNFEHNETQITEQN